MDVNAMEPYGQALLDYLHGDVSANVVVHRDDGYTGDMAASIYFRKLSDFSHLERTAMKLCRGDVLDIGAGAGYPRRDPLA